MRGHAKQNSKRGWGQVPALLAHMARANTSPLNPRSMECHFTKPQNPTKASACLPACLLSPPTHRHDEDDHKKSKRHKRDRSRDRSRGRSKDKDRSRGRSRDRSKDRSKDRKRARWVEVGCVCAGVLAGRQGHRDGVCRGTAL